MLGVSVRPKRSGNSRLFWKAVEKKRERINGPSVWNETWRVQAGIEILALIQHPFFLPTIFYEGPNIEILSSFSRGKRQTFGEGPMQPLDDRR